MIRPASFSQSHMELKSSVFGIKLLYTGRSPPDVQNIQCLRYFYFLGISKCSRAMLRYSGNMTIFKVCQTFYILKIPMISSYGRSQFILDYATSELEICIGVQRIQPSMDINHRNMSHISTSTYRQTTWFRTDQSVTHGAPYLV